MQKFGPILVIVLAVAIPPQAEAKHYNNCVSAYEFYLHDGKPHKAFATTNGTIPGHGDMACGGSGGDDPGHAVYAALNRCKVEADKAHYSGACRIIKKQ